MHALMAVMVHVYVPMIESVTRAACVSCGITQRVRLLIKEVEA